MRVRRGERLVFLLVDAVSVRVLVFGHTCPPLHGLPRTTRPHKPESDGADPAASPRLHGSTQVGEPVGDQLGNLRLAAAKRVVALHEGECHVPGNGVGLALELGRRGERVAKS
jgi:hypothetical protein